MDFRVAAKLTETAAVGHEFPVAVIDRDRDALVVVSEDLSGVGSDFDVIVREAILVRVLVSVAGRRRVAILERITGRRCRGDECVPVAIALVVAEIVDVGGS